MRRLLTIAGWNLGLLAAGLLIVELGFGGWLSFARNPGLWRLSIYRDVEWRLPAADKYARSQPVIYRRDTWGLRGNYGKPADVTILAMGGSTTDERFVSEGETWTDVLSDCLKRAGRPEHVANAGVAGQSTRGHLRNFDLWLPWIDGLAPRTILYYVGVNERALEGRLAEDDVTAYNESGRSLWLERMRQKSAVFALLKTIRGNMMAMQAGLHLNQIQGADAIDAAFARQVGSEVEIGSPDYQRRLLSVVETHSADLNAYEQRLHQLVARSKAMGAEPVLITQSNAPWRLVEGRKVRGDVEEHFMMAAINQRSLTVCRDTGIRCIGLADQLGFGDGDFYDGVHTTAQGSRKVGEFVCRALMGA